MRAKASLLSLVSLLTIAGLACIYPGYVGYEWNSGRTMYVYIDPSVDNNLAQGTGATPRQAITSAVKAWSDYMNSIAGVNIQLSYFPTGANLVINAADQGNNGSGASQPMGHGLNH